MTELDIVCPDTPDPEGVAGLEGCGSRRLEGPDFEGLFDCLDCGLWFDPTYQEKGAEVQHEELQG